MKGQKDIEVQSMSFFGPGDLWESFNEWSAYGAGVAIVLNGIKTFMQYYISYIFAFNLYL